MYKAFHIEQSSSLKYERPSHEKNWFIWKK